MTEFDHNIFIRKSFNNFNPNKKNSLNKHMIPLELNKIIIKSIMKNKYELIEEITSECEAILSFQKDKYSDNKIIMYLDSNDKTKLTAILEYIADWISLSFKKELTKVNFTDLIILKKEKPKENYRNIFLKYFLKWKNIIEDNKENIRLNAQPLKRPTNDTIEILDDEDEEKNIISYIVENYNGYAEKGRKSTRRDQHEANNRGFKHRHSVKNIDRKIKISNGTVDLIHKKIRIDIIKDQYEYKREYKNIDIELYEDIKDNLIQKDGDYSLNIGLILEVKGPNVIILALSIKNDSVSIVTANISGTMKRKKNRKKEEFRLSDKIPTLVLVSSIGKYKNLNYYIESKIDELLIYYLLSEKYIDNSLLNKFVNILYSYKKQRLEADTDIIFDYDITTTKVLLDKLKIYLSKSYKEESKKILENDLIEVLKISEEFLGYIPEDIKKKLLILEYSKDILYILDDYITNISMDIWNNLILKEDIEEVLYVFKKCFEDKETVDDIIKIYNLEKELKTDFKLCNFFEISINFIFDANNN